MPMKCSPMQIRKKYMIKLDQLREIPLEEGSMAKIFSVTSSKGASAKAMLTWAEASNQYLKTFSGDSVKEKAETDLRSTRINKISWLKSTLIFNKQC